MRNLFRRKTMTKKELNNFNEEMGTKIKREKTKLHQREEIHKLNEEVEQRLEKKEPEEQINQPEEEKKE